MAFLTYEKYKELGYSSIAEEQFPRWIAKAEADAKRTIFQRPFIFPDDDPSSYNLHYPKIWSELNERGICEVADARYIESQTLSNSGTTIRSFSNQNYSESYSAPEEIAKATQMAIMGIMAVYFTPEQRYRGVE